MESWLEQFRDLGLVHRDPDGRWRADRAAARDATPGEVIPARVR
jgi:hypothetical protein